MTMIEKVDAEAVVERLTAEGLIRMNLPPGSWRANWVTRFGQRTLPWLASTLVDADQRIGRDGMRAAAQWILPILKNKITVECEDNVPTKGPVLVVTNHPGSADFTHIFAALPRDDARVVAGTDMLDLLPNGKHSFLYTSEAVKRKKGETTRMLIDKLTDGNCVVLFPRGMIEPDPRWLPGARDTIKHWRRSMERIAAGVPDLTIVPTLVSGALSKKALNHWTVRYYRNQTLRSRGAAIIQTGSAMIQPDKWSVTPTVTFGRPIQAEHDVFSLVSAEMNRLITYARHPEWPLTHRTNGWI